ncbi:MAG: hypothetical protein LBT59_16850 [Clostridiales bacterium]|nr:hypothetical protein [Clostridiales bacterium]
MEVKLNLEIGLAYREGEIVGLSPTILDEMIEQTEPAINARVHVELKNACENLFCDASLKAAKTRAEGVPGARVIEDPSIYQLTAPRCGMTFTITTHKVMIGSKVLFCTATDYFDFVNQEADGVVDLDMTRRRRAWKRLNNGGAK